ncbi:hypothetical protein AALO_G00015480 [Alosa alosa]|uniref:Uncharacterized protein n=1 Tax=Alosa alosa TaxID=278164 RepID=A0AAV6HKS2_9TELE|nr:hypothetical protein AALO_G00015480 [Alosa alosa]
MLTSARVARHSVQCDSTANSVGCAPQELTQRGATLLAIQCGRASSHMAVPERHQLPLSGRPQAALSLACHRGTPPSPGGAPRWPFQPVDTVPSTGVRGGSDVAVPTPLRSVDSPTRTDRHRLRSNRTTLSSPAAATIFGVPPRVASLQSRSALLPAHSTPSRPQRRHDPEEPLPRRSPSALLTRRGHRQLQPRTAWRGVTAQASVVFSANASSAPSSGKISSHGSRQAIGRAIPVSFGRHNVRRIGVPVSNTTPQSRKSVCFLRQAAVSSQLQLTLGPLPTTCVPPCESSCCGVCLVVTALPVGLGNESSSDKQNLGSIQKRAKEGLE